MSSTAPPLEEKQARRVFLPATWLISKRVDLSFLFGGVFVSLALFYLWQARIVETQSLLLLWIFVFHGPHFWGQISRTFLDRSERATRGPVLWRSLLWFVVGPVFIGVGLVLESFTGRADFWQLFFFLAAIWAYHHVIKQHFGFMALYRAKHQEFDRGEFLFHKRYLITSLWLPIAMFFCTVALDRVPFVLWAGETYGFAGLLEFSRLARIWVPWIFVAVQLFYVLHLARRVAAGRGVNLPETLIIVASVSLHWIVVSYFAFQTSVDFAVALGVITASLTIYHNIQYHALLWYYNRAKYLAPNARENYGAAAWANKNMFIYFGLGVAYTFVTIGFQYYDVDLLVQTGKSTSGRAIALGLGAAIWGYSFVHYWLDGKIWHVREDEELRNVLGFAPPPAQRETGAS